jgi:hypothetical protein
MNNDISKISTHDVLLTRKNLGLRRPGDLGVLREVFHGFSEEARTRGIASPALAGFAFVRVIMKSRETASILGCT